MTNMVTFSYTLIATFRVISSKYKLLKHNLEEETKIHFSTF